MSQTVHDVFQESPLEFVDCDLLEAAKENVQPLASGRRVTALSSILSTPHPQRDAKLSATRNRLRINVELALDDEEDDPLEAYCRLIYWTVENYPQGHSAESGLLELLEEATRVLKDDRNERWRGELRYLKLWLLYASYVEKPVIIYRFLFANEIGTDHALLYEEYAAILERDGRRTEADEAYVLGIARQAAPLDHLKMRHREFQKRMVSAAPIPTSPTVATASVSVPTWTRTALGTTSLATTSPVATLPSQGSLSTRNPPSNGRLQIFVDPSGSQSESPGLAANAYPDIGTRKTRVKENVPEIKKLAGTTLRQSGKSKRVASSSSRTVSGSVIVPYRDPSPVKEMLPPALPDRKRADAVPKTPSRSGFTPFVDGEGTGSSIPATPKFEPFRDEVTTVASPTSAVAPDSVMKVKKAGMKGLASLSEAEALRKDPLKNYSTGCDD